MAASRKKPDETVTHECGVERIRQLINLLCVGDEIMWIKNRTPQKVHLNGDAPGYIMCARTESYALTKMLKTSPLCCPDQSGGVKNHHIHD